MKKTFISLLSVCLLSATFAYAEPVKRVEILGNERIESETVRSYVGLHEGTEFNSSLSSRVIKGLYATGLFNHVEVSWDAGTLTINVEENPLVNKIAFEGNEEVVDSRLEEFLSLKPRKVYSQEKVQRDVNTILAYYRQNGFFLARVTPQLIERDQNRVDVVFTIDEGSETEINNIRFVGNKRFDDGLLRTVIRTKESAWWRFLSSSDIYDPDQVEVDKEMLRRFYIRSGYADFNVISAVAELNTAKDAFNITFTVDEGPQYEFGEIDIRLDAVDEDLNRADLASEVEAQQGNIYNAEVVEADIDSLIQALGKKGFAFLDVKPTIKRHEQDQVIDVAYTLVPGPRVYVNRINVNGNDRTRDHVIRRELRLAEGDAFSTTKIKRSKDRLSYLGYFESVNVEHIETGMPDRVDLDIDVMEQSTGEFSAGAGVSSYEGFLFNVAVNERNFLGKGQKMKLGTTLSGRRQDVDFAFTEPYFMGRELAAGIDLFSEERDFDDESSYNLARVGGAVRFGFRLSEYARNNVRLGYKQTDIRDIDSDVSQFIAREEGEKDAITIGNTISYDNRDSYLEPTRGYSAALTTEYAGFGGDIDYFKAIVKGSWHTEVADEWILSLGGRVGAIAELGDELPVFEMFRLGGNNGLRGFDFSGVGPRDASTDDALGGQYLINNTIELAYPMGTALKEMGVKGLFFIDGGMVTEFEDHPDVEDSRTYRVSVGTGIHWKSPLGPIRFEFGLPIVKAGEDETRVFGFSFGTRF